MTLGSPTALWTASCDTPVAKVVKGGKGFPVASALRAPGLQLAQSSTGHLTVQRAVPHKLVSADTRGGGGQLPWAGNYRTHRGAGRPSSQRNEESPPSWMASRDATRNTHHHLLPLPLRAQSPHLWKEKKSTYLTALY